MELGTLQGLRGRSTCQIRVFSVWTTETLRFNVTPLFQHFQSLAKTSGRWSGLLWDLISVMVSILRNSAGFFTQDQYRLAILSRRVAGASRIVSGLMQQQDQLTTE